MPIHVSGVTTMGSDRANPGAPNHNGPNGGPQAQAVEQKHWPGPLICHNVVFNGPYLLTFLAQILL